MSNPIAAVRLEGTLSTQADPPMLNPGVAKPGAALKLAALKGAYHVVIVSPMACTHFGLRILVEWLRVNGLDAYDEIWQAPGIPDAQVWIDDEAHTL